MRCMFYALMWVCVLSGPGLAESLRLEVTRDTWVSAVGKEQLGNNGGSRRLKTKGVQEFTLVDIDPGVLRGRVVRGAMLHVNCAGKDPQRRLTVSTLASEWEEGTGSNYQVQKGSASFAWARTDQQAWAFAGSDITAVCNGMGNTIWRFADATEPDAEGWQRVAVDPDVVAARVAGLSHGFVVFDDVGSEYEREGDRFAYHLFPNRFLYSREQGQTRAPYFTIELGAEDRAGPEAVGAIGGDAKGLLPGEARVRWRTPRDQGPGGTLGFVARYAVGEGSGDFDWEHGRPIPQYLVPLAGGVGDEVVMHLRDLDVRPGETIRVAIRAVDRAGNVGPISTARVALAEDVAFSLEARDEPAATKGTAEAVKLGGVEVAVIDALDKVHPVTGRFIPAHAPTYARSNHLWSAEGKRIRLHGARNEFVEFQILLTGQADSIAVELTFDEPTIRAALHRFRHVKTKAGPLPDPLVPLEGPICIPATDERLAGQKHAALLAEVYIPHGVAAGVHAGTLKLRSGEESVSLGIELRVWDFVLPDYLSFIPEMNCYSLPRQAELDYYRLAHVHRTCLNRLGYSWRGTISDGCAPRWTGSEFEWSDYDRRFGPLLDGTAFADLPRRSVPVDAFYLPLNENWPLDVNQAFRGGYWIESAFDPAYRKGFVEVCAKFARHIREKKWTHPIFEFYLNNKVYFKDSSWSRCSAPWIFDEPVNTQDFWALRWYGQAFHEGVRAERGSSKLAFRCDISRPEWQRDLLDGVLDINVVGGHFRRYHRYVIDRKKRHGEMAINYGSSNGIEESNLQPAAWCLDTWCLEGDGVLPWQTIGTEKSWNEGDALSLFYPGQPVGHRGPLPSVRLKAYRRGQQDVEYLTVLGAATGRPRFAIARAVRQMLSLSGSVEQKSEEDAGLVRYARVDPEALHALRLAVGRMLDGLRPAPRRQYIDFRPPVREMSEQPHIGPIR